MSKTGASAPSLVVQPCLVFFGTVEPLITATSLQRPLFFRPGGQKIHTLTVA